MPNRSLTRKEMVDAVRLTAEVSMEEGFTLGRPNSMQKSAAQEAARRTGLNQATFVHRVVQARERLGITPEAMIDGRVLVSEEELETLPDGSEVIQRLRKRNAKYIQKGKRDMKKRVLLTTTQPFAIAVFGDPHMDNKGCNIEELMKDVSIAKSAGFRCIQIGDLIDNFQFIPKLAPNQADNPTTVSESWSLVRWLVRDAGLDWDAQILGNHDKWSGSAGWELLNTWAREAKTRFYDWIITIRYEWPGGTYTLCAAHDFKGTSIHNPLHGLMRRAKEDGTADGYVAGHRHNAMKGDLESGFREKMYNFCRVRGYKDFDPYAAYRGGYEQQEEGASAVFLIDPEAETMEGRCRVYYDFAEAAEQLQFLRKRWQNG